MEMDKLVSLCKRRGILFQSSEIYGGLNGFWDYGPLGVELKRNIKEAWWRDMVTGHDELAVRPGAPTTYEMVGLDCTIIMHPQVWKCSGHYDLFHDFMVDCRECRGRYRADHVRVNFQYAHKSNVSGFVGEEDYEAVASKTFVSDIEELEWSKAKEKALFVDAMNKANELGLTLFSSLASPFRTLSLPEYLKEIGKKTYGAPLDYLAPTCPKRGCRGILTAPREFNLMFKTYVGALSGEEGAAFLRPETAQGIFVNFKNVLDSSRVGIPFGIAQMGKSFRNEITPRNFTFRSREFEQMEIEFFCHPSQSREWYQYWRDRRYKWYLDLGLDGERLRLRDHEQDELSHYSCGTADIEYAFPFLPAGDFGELEGIAHRGDFDLRSHMEGKLAKNDKGELIVELGEDGKPKHRGSGKDLRYFNDQSRERYVPHVIEPSAGADRATLAFLCEAYHEDKVPDENGNPRERVFMKLHPRLAPVKAAVFPLVKKDGMPEVAQKIYRDLKQHFNVFYDEKGAVGRRYARQDEVGTPYCITVDGETMQNGSVTIRDRDSLKQWRVRGDEAVAEIGKLLRGTV